MTWLLRNIVYSLAWLAVFAGGFVHEFTSKKLAGIGIIALGFATVLAVALALGRFPRYGRPNSFELAREDLPLLFWIVVAVVFTFAALFAGRFLIDLFHAISA